MESYPLDRVLPLRDRIRSLLLLPLVLVAVLLASPLGTLAASCRNRTTLFERNDDDDCIGPSSSPPRPDISDMLDWRDWPPTTVPVPGEEAELAVLRVCEGANTSSVVLDRFVLLLVDGSCRTTGAESRRRRIMLL